MLCEVLRVVYTNPCGVEVAVTRSEWPFGAHFQRTPVGLKQRMTDALDIDGAHPVLNFGSYVELNRFLSRKNLDSLVTTFEHDPESIRGHRLSSRVRIFGPLGVVDCWYAIGGVAVWPPLFAGSHAVTGGVFG